jgi:hypothetical protein
MAISIILCISVLRGVMLSVAFLKCYTLSRYAECRYTECRLAVLVIGLERRLAKPLISPV